MVNTSWLSDLQYSFIRSTEVMLDSKSAEALTKMFISCDTLTNKKQSIERCHYQNKNYGIFSYTQSKGNTESRLTTARRVATNDGKNACTKGNK